MRTSHKFIVLSELCLLNFYEEVHNMTKSANSNIVLRQEKIECWTVPVLEITNADRPTLRLPVTGYIVNSVTENKARLQGWKVQIASEVKSERGAKAWNPKDKFAISVGFSFNIDSGWHGHRPLDVENFLKPVVDALAAGLFCDDETDPKEIKRWNYDDSNFNTLLIHRLDDAPSPNREGVAICVSSATMR